MVSILKGCPLNHSPPVWAPTKLDHNSGHPIAYSYCHQTITPRGATSSQPVRIFSDISVMGVSEGSMITHGGIAPPQQLRTTLRRCIEPSWSPTESNCCTTIGSISKQGYRTCPTFSATSEEKGKVKEKNFAFLHREKG